MMQLRPRSNRRRQLSRRPRPQLRFEVLENRNLFAADLAAPPAAAVAPEVLVLDSPPAEIAVVTQSDATITPAVVEALPADSVVEPTLPDAPELVPAPVPLSIARSTPNFDPRPLEIITGIDRQADPLTPAPLPPNVVTPAFRLDLVGIEPQDSTDNGDTQDDDDEDRLNLDEERDDARAVTV